MSIMDRLAKLDSAMQRGLDNGMAFVFGGKVVPAEIEELIKQEVQDNLRRSKDGSLYAPNVVQVAVSSKDLESLSQDAELPRRLQDLLQRFARNHGWSLVGPAVVRIAEESGLRTGQLHVSSYMDEDAAEDDGNNTGFDAIFHEAQESTSHEEESVSTPHNEQDVSADAATTAFRAQPAPTSTGPSVNLLLQDGSSRTYQVHEGSNIIGRSTEADLRLPDTGVSRQHAEITWNGSEAVLVDLQSTNGTIVNDTPIENWLLADGDVITMGHSHIEVRITGLK